MALMIQLKHADCLNGFKEIRCCLEEIHLTCKDKYRLKVKARKMIFQANRIPKQVEVVILIIYVTKGCKARSKETKKTTVYCIREQFIKKI
jgi:hypothetical protein